MAHLIIFNSSMFDIAKETPNEINPIAGEGVLKWLRNTIEKEGYAATDPDTEDWGWYMDIERGDEKYLLGASGEPEDGETPIEWTIQIHKNRTMKDKMLGRNKMEQNDPFFSLIERTIRAEPNATEIQTVMDT